MNIYSTLWRAPTTCIEVIICQYHTLKCPSVEEEVAVVEAEVGLEEEAVGAGSVAAEVAAAVVEASDNRTQALPSRLHLSATTAGQCKKILCAKLKSRTSLTSTRLFTLKTRNKSVKLTKYSATYMTISYLLN